MIDVGTFERNFKGLVSHRHIVSTKEVDQDE